MGYSIENNYCFPRYFLLCCVIIYCSFSEQTELWCLTISAPKDSPNVESFPTRSQFPPHSGIVVSALAWHSLGREIESCPGIWELLSTKHAMKWLLSLCGGSDGGLGEPGWHPGEHMMWCQDWNLRTFTFILEREACAAARRTIYTNIYNHTFPEYLISTLPQPRRMYRHTHRPRKWKIAPNNPSYYHR